ncbi:Cna B-type domain-containing protein, partial [Vagococcus sp.]|uniref:Cna B-type domain-containing protein n=1 Tax=Vagococcus sp. TaxID=1933889 RepID=UPI003F973B57
TVVLYQDGTEYARQEVKAGSEGKWSYEFKDLPEYSKGTTKRYQYTVKEGNVPKGYESSVSGYTITNTYQPITPGKPVDPTSPTKPKENLPKTGEQDYVGLQWVGLLSLFSGLGMFVYQSQRKRKMK